MIRSIHFVGFALASLTIATVALAQQSGGNGGQGGGGGDPSVLAVIRADAERQARLGRAVAASSQRYEQCAGSVCEQPRRVQFDADCSAGDTLLIARADGRQVRYICRKP